MEAFREEIQEFLECMESDATMLKTEEAKKYNKNLIDDLKEIISKYSEN